jgi:hypothetical protein
VRTRGESKFQAKRHKCRADEVWGSCFFPALQIRFYKIFLTTILSLVESFVIVSLSLLYGLRRRFSTEVVLEGEEREKREVTMVVID